MTMRMATLALLAAGVLGMAGAAQAQSSNTGNRANDPEMNHSTTTAPPSNSSGMSGQKNNMGTTGEGMGMGPNNPQGRSQTGNGGNASPNAGGEGRVNSKTQQ